MKHEAVVKAAVILLFAALTFVHLLPLSLHPARALNDPLDCLLNTWILSHTGNQAVSDPFRLFQGNVFHPHPDTVSYSEHLFPLAVMALPAAWISGNPVLAYNFIFFLAFVLNGFAAFLLVRHLTRSATSGIAGGIIYTFCSYQMQHVAHLQLINAWFIPLAFLYLHKYFERPVMKNAVLFSLFVTLQGLACIYYGLFLLSLLAVIFPLYVFLRPPRDKVPFFIQLLPPAAVSGLVLFLFSIPYLRLFRTFRFQRELEIGADLANFFAAWPANVMWGAATHSLGAGERYLFPGLLALALAAVGLAVKHRVLSFTPIGLRIALLVVAAGGAAVAAAILLTGGGSLSAGFAEISANNEAKPAFIALCGAGILLAVSLVFYRLRNSEKNESGDAVYLYLGLAYAALFLSFGREFLFNGLSPFDTPDQGRLVSPFAWLYDFVPGFKGIREPARYTVFIMLGLSVLAGFGLKALVSKFRTTRSRAVLTGCLLVFLNAEYLAVPVRTTFIPVGRDIPPTYEWLRNQPGDFAVAEIPFYSAVSAEAIPMYFSLFHGKAIVNGYSGFIPPAAWYIRSVFLGFPSWPSFDILNALEVRYIIFRPGSWGESRVKNTFRRLDEQFSAYARPVRVFRYPTGRAGREFQGLGEDHVFEIIRPERPPSVEPEDRPLDAGEWTARSNIGAESLDALADGDPATVWSTIRPRRSGYYLQFELDRARHVTRVLLRLQNYHTFAVDMLVETSLDGKDWWPHEFAYSAGDFALNLVHAPLDPVQSLKLDGRGARFIRITQRGGHSSHPWSVAEVEIRVAD
ncbi:MAG: discoidin domain-containing protein [Acidobacteriota bacterium]|nr:discoidin domain-containing protein [Acidobacteriota bacterium]